MLMYDSFFLTAGSSFSYGMFFERMKWMSDWPTLEHLQWCQSTLAYVPFYSCGYSSFYFLPFLLSDASLAYPVRMA